MCVCVCVCVCVSAPLSLCVVVRIVAAGDVVAGVAAMRLLLMWRVAPSSLLMPLLL